MVSMIKEINDNLKTILDNIKNNLDNSKSTLENIQSQMDKKVEEAKKYKAQVDDSKVKIKALEEDNEGLEASLKELSDKYGKMNLINLVEAGNKEIKAKINENLKEIARQKEHIADLTNKARTIKDLLIELKKDKTLKEEKLKNLTIVYGYYNDRVNEIIEYSFSHSENLADYSVNNYTDIDPDIDNLEQNIKNLDIDIDNTMIFDEIANIDENDNFKDEMSSISDNIDLDNDKNNLDLEDEEKINYDNETYDAQDDSTNEESANGSGLNAEEISFDNKEDNVDKEPEEQKNLSIEDISIDNINNDEVESENIDNNISDSSSLNTNQKEESNNVETFDDSLLDKENEERLDKIDGLFNKINEPTDNMLNIDNLVGGVETKIDNAYKDVFGTSVDAPIKKDPTLMDIFGNPIKSNEINQEINSIKKVEEIFVENGVDFNKFSENEQNYLKEKFDEEKYTNIFNTLKRNQINLDNVYEAYNIFGEISANELEGVISKLINCGQSVEAIGLILEKLPKIKSYNLDEAIISYGDYVKNIDITELIMKAKELSNGGNV